VSLVHKRLLFPLLFSFVFLGFHPDAKALSVGQAAVAVAVTTGAGAVLGASTLPFYAEPGKNTRNIFYGAALGAIGGVFLASYWGLRETQEQEDDASKNKRNRDGEWAWSRSVRPVGAEGSASLSVLGSAGNHTILSASLLNVQF
jgi:hypothetical protein